ncbi:MAG: prolyl oligopeptidase family serine peptidase [Pirellulales bacterium]|nr:prolyl oligopeptidase family serine peptidase [Pirellulales bacterium]
MKRLALALLLQIAAACSCPRAVAEPLAGTEPLPMPQDVVAEHLKQVTGYFLRRIDQAQEIRDRQWSADFRSVEAYETSMAGHRENLRRMLGLVLPTPGAGQVARDTAAEGKGHRVERLTIPIIKGLSARGLLLLPKTDRPSPLVLVCPDADAWPEKFTGLDGKVPAGWLAELVGRGAAVYVPQSVERLEDHPYCQTTNKKDRRKILYRLGYVVGCTMPGLDVQDVLAAVDHLASRPEIEAAKIALAGIGQGGMTAMYAAAADRRIGAVVVADYFQDRRRCWQEPVDRRLPGQLLEFGDAELAALVAPRPLTILNRDGQPAAADAVRSEAVRAAKFYRGLGAGERLDVVTVPEHRDIAAAAAAQAAELLGLPQSSTAAGLDGSTVAADAAAAVRNRHFEERLAWLRHQIDDSEQIRQQRWNITGRPAGEFPQIKAAMLDEYRKLVGCIPIENTPARPRSERVLSTDKYDGYQVLLDVTDGVECYGHLLVPRGIQGKVAAVVCQHGLSGRPEMITGIHHTGDTPYHEFGRHLAERGYVVFAPLIMHQYPVEQINDQARQADAAGMMRAAMVVAKTRRVVEFLQSLGFVDPERIGYYGLSYGGYSAIWCSPLVDHLQATVISGHFNDWRSKITSDATPTSYLRHPDDDFYNWDILHRFTHVELIAMIAPRPVCVEFGERDGITSPEWTAYAWSQVRAIREHVGLEDRIVLAHYDGVHEVHGVEAFDFLDRFVRPERPVGRDFVDGAPFITRNIDPANGVTGEFWIPKGARQFCGMAIKVSRSGTPGPLTAKFGSAAGRDDLGMVRLESGAVGEKPGFCEFRLEPKPVVAGETVYFEIRAESGSDGHSIVYGPKPIGGTYWADRFPIAYRVLTDRPADSLTPAAR